MSLESWKSFFEWGGVVLIALTVFFGAGAVVVNHRLSKFQDERLRKFQIDLANARGDAARADIKRLELENRIADIFGPRRLTKVQSARIVKELGGLEGTKIDVYAFALGNPYDPTESRDSLNIARDVVSTLRDAHIDAEGWLLGSCQGGAASNLVVSVTGNSSQDRKVASRLIEAFRHEIGTYPEIGAYSPSAPCTKFSDLDIGGPNKRKHDAAISITIGRKINPLLTRGMLEPPDGPEEP